MRALHPVIANLVGLLVAVLLPSDGRASEQVAAKAGCSVCHAASKKVLGPSYRDIAIKYRNRSDAVSWLTGRVRQGSKDVWGPVAMPATEVGKISEADLKAVLTWILKTPS